MLPVIDLYALTVIFELEMVCFDHFGHLQAFIHLLHSSLFSYGCRISRTLHSVEILQKGWLIQCRGRYSCWDGGFGVVVGMCGCSKLHQGDRFTSSIYTAGTKHPVREWLVFTFKNKVIRVPTGPETSWNLTFHFTGPEKSEIEYGCWKSHEKVLIFASVILKNQDTESVIFSSNILNCSTTVTWVTLWQCK